MTHDDDRPIDFSALDPAADELAFARRLRAIRDAAAPELARRRALATPLGAVGRWTRWVAAAAAAVTLASGAVLARVPAAPPPDEVATAPATLEQWAERGETPSPADLLQLSLEATP